MMDRAGKTVHNLQGINAYDSFYPAPLPPGPPVQIDREMQQLLIEAYKSISLLNGLSDRIVNKDLFISMYVRKEALVSSQIEGTQCTLEDILNPTISENANADVSDVVNYIRAVNYSLERIKDLPLCCRLIRETHRVLMNSVRGCEKTPGEFRTSQNWIGGAGSTLKNARYIPPNPEDMAECMSSLEKYMNIESGEDPLIRAALVHYQFETIHPFLDGNGRVGRLLITLFLISRKVIDSPILYLSCYLKSNQVEYYDRMSEIRRSGNYEQWVRFFLRGIRETADDAIETIDRLTELHKQSEALLKDTPTRSRGKIMELLAYLEKNPIIETGKTAEALDCSYTAMTGYISILCEKGILQQTAKSGKARIYSYEDYLAILRNNT
ncbi:MAG: Fic family protein [Lachnospiraceae bacterium]|nr:Fic family protein [Lachnospiraceae bacterium]